jgi:hypothetical protein
VEKKSVGLLELETAVLECFLEKTPLSPLGVKQALKERKKCLFFIHLLLGILKTSFTKNTSNYVM